MNDQIFESNCNLILYRILDVWAVRILVQNGIFLFASWLFTIFLVCLDQTLVVHMSVAKKISHLIILGIFFFKLLVYFLIENLFAYKYCKFIFTPWIIYALFLYDTIMNQALILNKPLSNHSINLTQDNSSFLKTNTSFFAHAFLLAILFFFVVAKIFKFFWCECRRYNNYASL